MDNATIIMSGRKERRSGPSDSSRVRSKRSPILRTPRKLLQLFNSSTIDSTGKKASIIRRKGVRMKAPPTREETVIARKAR